MDAKEANKNFGDAGTLSKTSFTNPKESAAPTAGSSISTATTAQINDASQTAKNGSVGTLRRTNTASGGGATEHHRPVGWGTIWIP